MERIREHGEPFRAGADQGPPRLPELQGGGGVLGHEHILHADGEGMVFGDDRVQAAEQDVQPLPQRAVSGMDDLVIHMEDAGAIDIDDADAGVPRSGVYAEQTHQACSRSMSSAEMSKLA